MVSSTTEETGLISNIRLSSVGTSTVTAPDVVQEADGVDLAMKLHYIKSVYIFDKEAGEGLTIMRVKESLFYLLNDFYVICGRFRLSESGRPYIKCNDCGVRFVEADCEKTVEEWLAMKDQAELHDHLVYYRPIGPEISFSPLVHMQLTRFKCGGAAVGLNWIHVLGDQSASAYFLNKWGSVLAGLRAGNPPPTPVSLPPIKKLQRSENPPPVDKQPISLKRVDPVGDIWELPGNSKMGKFSFHLSPSHLSRLQSQVCRDSKIPEFESVCAIIWQSIANISSQESQPRKVTLFKTLPFDPKTSILGNNQIISAIEVDFSIPTAHLKNLAESLLNEATDERDGIKSVVEADIETSDFIIYGANLTLVNLENANVYGLKLNEQSPKLVYYNVEGVGDGGVVLVLPVEEDSSRGMFVTVTMLKDQMSSLKNELTNRGVLLNSE
ncbi:protein ECERIFERUM 26-like [Carica papaya]|uniref:protein ECERIFERUM 26-like n=1 Tax=Carica papaya TaxID=3649 RepID=UPI000B8C7D36|nr:protein ECERIFERUM 26-like [Carica papaya]